MEGSSPSDWIDATADAIDARAERDLAALVGVSSPSGDRDAAEEAVAVAIAMLPESAGVERPDCSTPGAAPDLLARIEGTGAGRLLLLGHLDTVVPHARHRRLSREGERLYGSGAIDMLGGDVLALGLMRALAARPELFAEVSLLFVNDEEWRSTPFVHGERFAGYDACFCFEAGERLDGGEEAVVVRRKAACGLGIAARGRAAHSGAKPENGRNALLALARLAGDLARLNDPAGADRLTVVPTVFRAGEALNVVPGEGELRIDLRADHERAFEPVFDAVPEQLDGVRLRPETLRRWPGMDAAAAAAPLLERAAGLLAHPLHGSARGGASDASHLARHVATTIDGLGPIGAGAHAPDEHLLGPSIRPRARIAAALCLALLAPAS